MAQEAAQRILVISIDRDNDLGRKTSLSGPVVGRKSVLAAATEFGVADPSDSDMNAIFQAIRIFDEVSKRQDAEVCVLTGHQNVGVQSDAEITRQLEAVLKKFKASSVVLVSDGTEDEHILPIIQSRIPILSVNRIVVKQAEQLESAYFKFRDFLSESLEDPKVAGVVFGLPAITLLLYGIFGSEGIRLIILLLGAYLFVKGFKLEDAVLRIVDEFRVTLEHRKFAFFLYMVALVLFGLATYRGFLGALDWVNIGAFETAASFLLASVYIYFLSVAVGWIGRNSSVRKRSSRRVLGVVLFGFALAVVAANAAELVLRSDVSPLNFLTAVGIGFALLVVALLIEYRG